MDLVYDKALKYAEGVDDVHYERKKQHIFEALKGRQNIIAAQNPLILDRIGFQDEEQMQNAFILCREERGQFVWENAKPEDVHEVFRAYDVGLQNVSEILWQKGLW